MSKTGSYIKIDRGLKSNPLWLEEPFTKGQAWVDMLLLAQGVDKEKRVNGKKKTLKRGNIYTSTRFLAKRWRWSRMKLYRFLETLVLENMIKVSGWEVDNGSLVVKKRDHPTRPPCETTNETTCETADETTNETTITIVNWALYQYSETTNETTNETSDVRKTRPRNETTKRDTQENIYTEKDIQRKKQRIPPKSPKGDLPPDGGTKKELPDRDKGTLADIPEMFKGRFKTYKQFYDWRNQ